MLLIEKLSMRSKACDIKRREFHIYMFIIRPRSHGTGRIRDRAQIRPNPPCVHTGPWKSDEFEHHLPDEFATKKS